MLTNNKKNGVINEVTHLRDYSYDIVCGSSQSVNANEYPKEYEIPRENTGTLKNQGIVGACVAEVCVQIAEEWWKREFEEQIEHSEGFFYGANRSETSVSEGMIPSSALDYWMKHGTVPKTLFDILVEMPDMKKICRNYPELYEEAKKYRLPSYVRLRDTGALDKDTQIKDALMKYQYGLVAISPNGFSGGSHCILLTGWNDKTNKYKFKNSWGEKYGDNGFGEIAKSKITEVYLPLFEKIELPFEDVDPGAWYYKDLKNMFFSGLVKGKSDTKFDPDAPITRAEMTVMLNRVIKEVEDRFELFSKLLSEKAEIDLL